MKIPKIELHFDQYFKLAIVFCAILFIYSNWNKGRYLPYFSSGNSHSLIDTKTGIIYVQNGKELFSVEMLNVKESIKK